MTLLAALFIYMPLLCGCSDKADPPKQPTLEELRQEARRLDQLGMGVLLEQEALEDSLDLILPLPQPNDSLCEKALYLVYRLDSLQEVMDDYMRQLKAVEDTTRQLYDTYCL